MILITGSTGAVGRTLVGPFVGAGTELRALTCDWAAISSDRRDTATLFLAVTPALFLDPRALGHFTDPGSTALGTAEVLPQTGFSIRDPL